MDSKRLETFKKVKSVNKSDICAYLFVGFVLVSNLFKLVQIAGLSLPPKQVHELAKALTNVFPAI